jgi:hypothetical protein
MAKMVLGSYTFEWNPEQYTIPEKQRSYSVVPTYVTAAFFSWGVSRIGKEIVLEWDMMKEAQWDSIQTILEADTEVLWYPEGGAGASYTVEVVKLQGEYVEKSISDAPYRRRVQLTLILKS